MQLDASMAPEMEVTSTVASGNSSSSSDSDQSNEMPTTATVSAVSLNSNANLPPNIDNQFKVNRQHSFPHIKFPSNHNPFFFNF